MFQYYNNLNNLKREREEKINKQQSLTNSFHKSAFSLVELSIVLIIIGLLISAVIGGKALIEQAKVITIMNEFNEIMTAVQQAVVNDPKGVNNIAHSSCNKWSCGCTPGLGVFKYLTDKGYLSNNNRLVEGETSGSGDNRTFYYYKSKIKYHYWTFISNCYDSNMLIHTFRLEYRRDEENTYGDFGIYVDAKLGSKVAKKIVDKYKSKFDDRISKYTTENSIEAISKDKKWHFIFPTYKHTGKPDTSYIILMWPTLETNI